MPPPGELSFSYDSPGEPYRYLPGPRFRGSDRWLRHEVQLEGAELRGRQHGGADLRLMIRSFDPVPVRRVALRRSTALTIPDAPRAVAATASEAPPETAA